MNEMAELSLKAKNVKCFGDQESGFDTILPINLIIGRNNSGKSTLLDIVAYATDQQHYPLVPRRGKAPEVLGSYELTRDKIRLTFGNEVRDSQLPEPIVRCIGHRLVFSIEPNKLTSVSVSGENIVPEDLANLEKILNHNPRPFAGRVFKRLVSDRDISPEGEMSDPPSISANGRGATDAFTQFLTKAKLPRELVEKRILSELNSIFQPDSTFGRIVAQRLDNGMWEIFLEEEGKGLVPLSGSGSGLKTILLVLAFVYLIPQVELTPLWQYIFGFEELENNLHPALQRRLLLYLRRIAVEKNVTLFITTHSNVVIDLFGNDPCAQIIHVTHDGEKATTTRAATFVKSQEVLDDLGVRASDLLQSNCVIWVEGPSDKRYITRWIELWSDGGLQEGTHYQCAFYGGSLLAHLSATPAGNGPDDPIKILRINRHAIVVMDSDRATKKQEINTTKKRVISEIENAGGISWVTKGRTIEHYIPLTVVRSHYSDEGLQRVKQFQSFSKYLETIRNGEGKRFETDKAAYAAKMRPLLTKENLKGTLDIDDQLDRVCNAIREWNYIQAE